MTGLASYKYEAVGEHGASEQGQIEAPGRASAIRELTGRGLYVTDLSEVNGEPESAITPDDDANEIGSIKRVKRGQMVMVWRQLATGMNAGLPLLNTLQIVSKQSDHSGIKQLLNQLAKRVQGGDALSDAIREHPKVFSRMQVSMVKAGETAGVLEEVFGSLTDFAEREHAVKQKVGGAMLYPMIVLGLAGLSVIVIMTFILPTIIDAVSDSSVELPLPTRILMSISYVMTYWGWLILIGIGIGWWKFRTWRNTDDGRFKFDGILLKMPVVGNTLRKIAVARFARALGTMSGSGIQILEALGVLRDSLGNEALGREIDNVKEAISQGAPIAKPLEATGQFPAMFIQVVSLGEKSGRLDELLVHAADAFDKETEAAIDRMMTVLPAVVILGLAFVVAFILASVLLPIMNMQNAVV
ncbi:type II secretion system F family protein [Poriferisphaera sp. WC338]|uniref:type II secretion system F family protein n=1 Tax=Poriferisphaera sp. WC338 TaxID=3425129 RepID=UPI003D81B061